MQISETLISVETSVRLHVTIYEADLPLEQQRDVLLLHGWPNSGRVWCALAEEMIRADSRYRLIAPTFRGYGKSDAPSIVYTCTQFATDIQNITNTLSLQDYALIGHSMGGKIAQVLASERPPGLTELVLLAPSPAGAAHVPEAKRREQKQMHGKSEKIRQLILGMVAHDPESIQMAMLLDDGEQVSEAAFTHWIDPMREEDFSRELSQISVPTLVLLGTKDPLRTEETTRASVADRIPNARFSAIPNVGHLLPVEDPTALALAVVNFLDAPTAIEAN